MARRDPTAYAVLGRVRPDAARHRFAGGLLVAGGRVAGYERAARAAAARGVPVYHLPDRWLVQPAFRDPHLHLLGAAVGLLLSVDVRAERHPTVAAVLGALGVAAAAAPPGAWLRAAGLDEALLAERRTPTAAELDTVTPDHPLVLRHRTGHAVMLNTLASQMLRAVDRRDRPPGTLLAPELVPDGLAAPTPAALAAAVSTYSGSLAAAGVVAVADATAANDPLRLALLDVLAARGAIVQDVTVMPGSEHLEALVGAGLSFGRCAGAVTVGHAKIVPIDDDAGLRERVRQARAAGFAVAIHVLDPSEIDAALRALAAAPRAPGAPADRLEHVGLCLPEQHAAISRAGVTVVSNPAFLPARGRKYEAELSGLERGWLYPVRSLLALGVPVAAASDAPVTDVAPLRAVEGAVRRRGASCALAPHEAVGVGAALDLVTHGAARAMGGTDGRLAPGAPADFVVLDDDPFAVASETLGAIGIVATVKSGAALWGAGALAECTRTARVA
jgi:predicted amidohydrolase YtcJ